METNHIAVETSPTTQSDSIVRQTNKRSSFLCLSFTVNGLRILITWVSEVLKSDVWDDIYWRFGNLNGSHYQSQVAITGGVANKTFSPRR